MRMTFNGDRVVVNDCRSKAKTEAEIMSERIDRAMRSPEGLYDIHGEAFVKLQDAQAKVASAIGRGREKAEKELNEAQAHYNYVHFLVWDTAADLPSAEPDESAELARLNESNAAYWSRPNGVRPAEPIAALPSELTLRGVNQRHAGYWGGTI